LIVKSIVVECPNCQLEIKASKWPYTAGKFGTYTDMKVKGRIPCNPPIIRCKRCNYIFYDKNLELDKNLLQTYLKNEEYKKLVTSEEKVFLVIYEIYKKLSLPLNVQNKALLHNYYASRDLEDLKLLTCGYEQFLDSNGDIDKEFIFAKIMTGEFYRRSGSFRKAKIIFEEIVNLKQSNELNLIDMCNFQLELIEQQDTKLMKCEMLHK